MVDDLTMVIDGCGYATTKESRPSSNTPSTPSLPRTRMFQVPSAGVGVLGSTNWYSYTQTADEVELQVAPTCVMGWLVTGVPVGVPASVIQMFALEMSKLPNGSLTVARTNTVAPG